jgi:hypothetical protein
MFGLGALLYLADCGKSAEVTSIASVSGGSLTNGFVAQTVSFPEVDSATFEARMRPLAQQIAQRGTFFATYRTRLYLVVLASTLVGAVVAPWLLSIPGIVEFLVMVLLLVLWVWLVAGRRGVICAKAFAQTLFSPTGNSPTLLADINAKTDHIFCATELQSAEHFYFSGQFVFGYQWGPGTPGRIALHEVVQASAALPVAFPARWFRRSIFYSDQSARRPGVHARYLVLADGGVYDNMADQYAQGLADKSSNWRGGINEPKTPDELIVVNGSRGLGWRKQRRSLIPVLGEVASLLREKDIMYDQTTALRRRGLTGRFDLAERTGTGLKGALVYIPQDPYYAARRFERADQLWAERAARARAMIAKLETESIESEEEWKEIAAENARIRTSLTKLGDRDAARLMYQGYVLAMANLYVILNYPLLRIPRLQRFETMAS